MFSENSRLAESAPISSTPHSQQKGEVRKEIDRAAEATSYGIAIHVQNLSKCYQIYDAPRDRLKQFIAPRLQRLVGQAPRQYFREFWALKEVTFQVRKGETVGIVGKNGSGKSTLLQLICGTLSPTKGTIETGGRIAALLELGAGFNPEFTGRENVYMNAAVLGLTREETDSRFRNIEAFADIGDFINQPVKSYSSGMTVRLAFAVAINVDPEILIVDEALSVGDELFQRKCFSRIEAIKKSGATILFVSHAGSTVVELCDRAILLDSGDLLAVGAPKTIVARYQKLLYAPESKREQIRKEIKASVNGISDPPHESRGGIKSDFQSKVELVEPKEFYDPNLKPQSTIAYEAHGAVIECPQIVGVAGDRLNCLRRGGTYYFRYNVRFQEGVSGVRFGMLIKTTSGVELGGGVSAASLENSLAYASASSCFEVEFRFQCLLNPGIYYLNAGVVGIRNREEIYLHRLIDIIVFRVLPDSRNLATGTVDFGCQADFRQMEVQAQEKFPAIER